MTKKIKLLLALIGVFALMGCVSMFRQAVPSAGTSPSVAPPVKFEVVDENKDGNITKEELATYNQKNKSTQIVYGEPTKTFFYIMLAVMGLCGASILYEGHKIKHENKCKDK